jgi:hypothetical protein
MELINQGLGGLNTPLGMLGTQLMANSGPQPGNPGGGARLGQAFAGMQQQMGQQQALEQQQLLRQIQQQELSIRAAQMQREAKKEATLQNVLSSPEAAQGLTPIQRQLLMAGVPMADIVKMQPQAKQPTPPGMFDMPQPDKTYIRKVWNPSTGTYDESVPFVPPQAQTAGVAVERLNMDKTAQPIELAAKQTAAEAQASNAQATADRVAMEQAKAQREADKNVMESKFKRLEFKQAYRGAVAQLDEVEQLATKIANSKALDSLYGPDGKYIPPIAGTAAADLLADINQLKAKGGLAELVKLKQNGVALTPVSNTDLAQAQTSFGNFDQMQSGVKAREVFANTAEAIRKAKAEAAQRYNEYDSLYDAPSAGSVKQNAPSVPAVGTVMDGYRYNGGDPASPSSWSKM